MTRTPQTRTAGPAFFNGTTQKCVCAAISCPADPCAAESVAVYRLIQNPLPADIPILRMEPGRMFRSGSVEVATRLPKILRISNVPCGARCTVPEQGFHQ